MPSSESTRRRWRAYLLSTEPADRPRAEAVIRDLYVAAGLDAPRYFCWFDSPAAACWAVAVLIESRQAHWADILAAARRSAGDRERIAGARQALCACCSQPGWELVVATIGSPLGMRMQYPPQLPAGLIQPAIISARIELYGGDVTPLFSVPGADDALHNAEHALWGRDGAVLTSGVHCPTAGTLLSQCFYVDYPFATIASDEDYAGTRTPPVILSAAWAVARSTGPWWPFANGAILIDRPVELHTSDAGMPHRGDGAAVVYRDGSRAYAWEGNAIREEWVLHPERIAPGTLRQLPRTFRAFVEARVGTSSGKTSSKAKASAVLSAQLPVDLDGRVQALRAHAGGSLPLFDLYVAGQHRRAWSELMERGPAVRQDPHAADALAVAYETMRRVAHNVRTVADRLVAIGYRFGTPGTASSLKLAYGPDSNVIDLGSFDPSASPHAKGLLGVLNRLRGALGHHAQPPVESPEEATARPHVPPDSRVANQLRRMEKRTGLLPLSVRAFYEVVGAVDFNGVHPSLAPPEASTCPDPLVVYGPDDVLAELDGWEDRPSQIAVAPDDLHKAGTSGGDGYAIAVPDARADGELLNERHDLLFTDYLRLCFQWGGFPGYEGQDRGIPPEIEALGSGLIEF
jgi:hypothetical protein